MNHLENMLSGVKSVAISGHVRPDGDCVGSCLGLYNYIKENFQDIQVTVYLEQPSKVFGFLQGAEAIYSEDGEAKAYDLFFALDCGDKERLGKFATYFDTASHTICIDHHILQWSSGTYNPIKRFI